VPWAYDAVRLLPQTLSAVTRPFPTCMTELAILDGARVLAKGADVFPRIGELPFSLHIYNTLNYLPAGLAGRVFDLDGDGLLVASRIVPATSTLALLALVFLWARALAPSSSSASAAVASRTGVALFAVLAVVFFHSSTLTDFFRNRPETPGLLFSFAGWLACVPPAGRARIRRWPLVGAGCFALAFFFKQTFLAAPAAAFAALVITRQPRREVAQLVAATAAFVAAGSALSFALLGHGYFEHTYRVMVGNPREFAGAFMTFFPVLVGRHWGLLLVSVAPALVVAVRARDPIALWLAICFAWTVIIESKAGADINYHAELSFLMVLVVVAALARALDGGRHLLAAALLLPLATATVSGIARFGIGANDLCFNRIAPSPHCFSEEPPSADRAEAVARWRAVVGAAHAGAGDDGGLPLILDPEIGVRVGAPAVNDWYLLGLLFDEGLLDFAKLEHAVRSRRPPWIVFHVEQTNRWTIRLYRLALASGYRVVRDDRDGIVELSR
jgi:hypothetical protein